MSDDEIKNIAEGMGIKKVNPANREDNIYKILDQQAINLAANAPDEAPRKRGRKPKNKAMQEQAASENAPVAEDGAAVAADKENAPRKRGRKPGSKNAARVKEPVLQLTSEEIMAADPDNTSDATPLDEPQPQPKKRGRKPKARQEEPAVADVPEAVDGGAGEAIPVAGGDAPESGRQPESDAARLIGPSSADASAEEALPQQEQTQQGGVRVFTPRNAGAEGQNGGVQNQRLQRGPK
ncbi:MAG: hypothetical protein K2K36_02250, partial [Muribaculaceae bacterium]|nr:hypothetical protein [Muribaculaceae bacterium]